MSRNMYPTVKETNPPTSRREIETLEQILSVKLPESYKLFLLTSNGGRPAAQLFPIEDMEKNPFGNVNFFFGVNADSDAYDIAKATEFYRPRLPHALVLIAENGMGDYVCLDLRDNNERVIFWDNRHFWSTGEWREQDIYAVAGSFEEFLRLLIPYPG